MSNLLSRRIWLGALAAIMLVHAAAASAPARYVIGISPFLEKGDKDPVYRGIISFALEQAPLNSTIGLYDAYHLKTIAEINVPEARAFQSAKTRANQFTEQFVLLRKFLATEHSEPKQEGLKFKEAVRLPQFMDFVAENIASSSSNVTALVVGSALYVDEKEPGFSMVGGFFPSDGHLLASREKTVFGVSDRANSLKGVTAHLVNFGDEWVSQLHQDKTLRFWSLYMEGRGGRLGAFGNDLRSVLAAASPSASQSPRREYALDPTQTKIEMVRITRDVDATRWITQELARGRELPPPSRLVGPMKIGIRWQGDLDLDLYAAASERSQTLYFERTRVAEGYYFKDHRSSPEREFEFIEFESPVDVWKVAARVNLYEGDAPEPPSGEIRIEFDGRIYTGDFRFAARSGNKGREGRGQDAHWVTIDVPGLLKLRSAPVAAR